MKKLEFVHQFLPATAPGSRTLLLLHGTGGDESDLIPLGRELDPECGASESAREGIGEWNAAILSSVCGGQLMG